MGGEGREREDRERVGEERCGGERRKVEREREERVGEVVLESPVQSGLLSIFGKTETETGL